MRITEKQRAFLDGLVCQRLTAERKNRDQVPNFINQRSRVLTEFFLDEAWDRDEGRNGAIYIIKNPQNQILLYFGLRCGELQTPLDEQNLRDNIARINDALYRLRFRTGLDDRDEVNAFIESLRNGRPDFDLTLDLSDRLDMKNNKLRDLERDKHKEENAHVVRVLSSFPAVELTHFVSNDCAEAFWSRSGIRRSMGTTLFWQFVVPKVLEIRELAGCEYLYLFAADETPDKKLLEHYRGTMDFSQPEDVGTNKPRYDFTCEFMCQKTGELKEKREAFFENFNGSGKCPHPAKKRP